MFRFVQVHELGKTSIRDQILRSTRSDISVEINTSHVHTVSGKISDRLFLNLN